MYTHNEVMAGMRWSPNLKVTVFSNNLESRLLAQLRAADIGNRMQCSVPIVIYPDMIEYSAEAQQSDLVLAKNSPLESYVLAAQMLRGESQLDSASLADFPKLIAVSIMVARIDPSRMHQLIAALSSMSKGFDTLELSAQLIDQIRSEVKRLDNVVSVANKSDERSSDIMQDIRNALLNLVSKFQDKITNTFNVYAERSGGERPLSRKLWASKVVLQLSVMSQDEKIRAPSLNNENYWRSLKKVELLMRYIENGLVGFQSMREVSEILDLSPKQLPPDVEVSHVLEHFVVSIETLCLAMRHERLAESKAHIEPLLKKWVVSSSEFLQILGSACSKEEFKLIVKEYGHLLDSLSSFSRVYSTFALRVLSKQEDHDEGVVKDFFGQLVVYLNLENCITCLRDVEALSNLTNKLSQKDVEAWVVKIFMRADSCSEVTDFLVVLNKCMIGTITFDWLAAIEPRLGQLVDGDISNFLLLYKALFNLSESDQVANVKNTFMSHLPINWLEQVENNDISKNQMCRFFGVTSAEELQRVASEMQSRRVSSSSASLFGEKTAAAALSRPRDSLEDSDDLDSSVSSKAN